MLWGCIVASGTGNTGLYQSNDKIRGLPRHWEFNMLSSVRKRGLKQMSWVFEQVTYWQNTFISTIERLKRKRWTVSNFLATVRALTSVPLKMCKGADLPLLEKKNRLLQTWKSLKTKRWKGDRTYPAAKVKEEMFIGCHHCQWLCNQTSVKGASEYTLN